VASGKKAERKGSHLRATLSRDPAAIRGEKQRESAKIYIGGNDKISLSARVPFARTGHSALNFIPARWRRTLARFLILVGDKSETSRITHAHTHAPTDTDTPQGGNKRFVAAARQEPPSCGQL
jgi:hypothetical protein